MIPWDKFRSDKEPSYSDHVYQPTRRLLERFPTFPHQSRLMNALPLLNADDRRFVISQWPPDQRAQHLSTFHADHTGRIQDAIDTLVGYYERHELKPLSAYDHHGWPVSFDSKDNRRLDDSSESEIDHEETYDFPSSLAGLSLDMIDGLFGTKGIFDPERGYATELSLSPSPTNPRSPSQLPQVRAMPSQSPMSIRQRTPTPPPPTATTQSSQPPPLTSITHAAPNKTLSIANLIHPNASPDAMSASSSGGPDPSDPDIIALLSTRNVSLLTTTFSTVGARAHASPSQHPQPRSPTSPTTEQKHNTLNQLSALRHQGTLPVPLRGTSRTYKALRMRRNSRERAGSDAGIEKVHAKPAASESFRQLPASSKHPRPKSSSSSDGYATASFQPYSYEHGGIDWSQPLERASTASPCSYTANDNNVVVTEERDKYAPYAAHHLPTAAIKYEPLDDPPPRLVLHDYQHGQQRQRQNLKRKERDEDDDDGDHAAAPSSRRRLAPSPGANTRASYWPAIHHPSSYDSARYGMDRAPTPSPKYPR